MLNKTKIISTIGPSTNHPHLISKLIKNGMNVARLNMSHESSPEEIKTIIKSIRLEAKKLDKHIGIMMDISGPKIRVDLSNIGNEKVEITEGHVYTLGYSKMNDIPINMEIEFKDSMDSKACVKIDDGNINFKIIKIKNNIIKLKALENGIILSNKGVNFPGLSLNIPPVTPKDKKDIKLGIKLEIDWFALSFVRSPNDIKPFLKCYKDNNVTIPVIAKIEKPEAVKNLDEIIDAFNGVLIARGDLGVEMSLSMLPVLQKKIIKKCRLKKKPVIIATQMLESMTKNSSPTRAEVSDVATSVYQGADSVMLSGETAVGDYPIESVAMMTEIITNIEKEMFKNEENKIRIEMDKDYRSAIGEAVKTISKHLEVNSIVVMTESGSTARIVSHYRTQVNIFALSPSLDICNRMSLFWGVTPILTNEYLSTDEMLIDAERILLDKKYMKKGQTFIMTAGAPVGVAGSTNMLKIQKIGS